VVVVSRQVKSAVKRFLMGSVSDRVVKHAPCDVLVAR
jgi:nucleotide-binding universal stress UspA family protein